MCCLYPCIHDSAHTFVGGVRSVVLAGLVTFWRLATCCVRLFRYSELSRVAMHSFPAFTCDREEPSQ